MFVLLWISPGIVILICYFFQWYGGKDITYGDIKILALMTSLGIFIPVMEKEIAAIKDDRVIIKGRKKEEADG